MQPPDVSRAEATMRPHDVSRSEATMQPSRDISRLVEIMAALRTPVTGCPWDLEQTFRSILPYTIEETYEVADAIMRDDMEDLREELGDLLLQVVYHARMAEERGAFGLADVVEGITAKMIRRHPHVFGSERARSAGSAKGVWNAIKAEEKAERDERRHAAGLPPKSTGALLDKVPDHLPPLEQADLLHAAMAKVGFDWPDAAACEAKVREELEELAEASGDEAEEELGDLLAAVVNLARHRGVDPARALMRANLKMRRRFGAVERQVGSLANASLDEMEAAWSAAKREESVPE